LKKEQCNLAFSTWGGVALTSPERDPKYQAVPAIPAVATVPTKSGVHPLVKIICPINNETMIYFKSKK